MYKENELVNKTLPSHRFVLGSNRASQFRSAAGQADGELRLSFAVFVHPPSLAPRIW
jgi:hypothetical protein